MLVRARSERPDLPRSVEIEKPRPGIERLFADADLLLFSQAFARHRGFTGPEAFLARMHREAPHAELVCTWGADGAYAIGPDSVGFWQDRLADQGLDFGDVERRFGAEVIPFEDPDGCGWSWSPAKNRPPFAIGRRDRSRSSTRH